VIYDIRHVTTYSYESPVSFARCSLRLEPKSGDGQQLVSHSVEIRPRPADRTARRDFFGTHTESVLIETAHRTCASIPARGFRCRARRPAARAKPAWESVRDVAFEANQPRPRLAGRLRLCQPLVPVLRRSPPMPRELSAGRRHSGRRRRPDAPHPHAISNTTRRPP
jgi:transglutaminase-like putative cysteine protease